MFQRNRKERVHQGEEENPFLLSFSDLMASLLAIFILSLVVLMIQLHLKQKELEEDRKKVRLSLIELKDTLNEIQQTQGAVASALEGVGLREKSLEGMLDGIQKDLKKQGIEVLVTENGSVLRIPEQALSFETNRFSIQERYRPTADVIGSALLQALRQDANRKLLDTVFIEGHTDAVPNRSEMGNWGLSTYRAISLWLYWTETPGLFGELKALKSMPQDAGKLERPLISTSGYAETRPTVGGGFRMTDGVAVPNAADRRIDIRFSLTSSEKKDLGEVREKLNSMRAKTDSLVEKLEGLK